MHIVIAFAVSALVGVIVGVEMSKRVMASALAVVAQAHAVVSGGAKDVQELAARVSAVERRVEDAVKAKV